MTITNKKKEIISLLRHSNDELKKYKKSNKFVHLSQACEKTWVAFGLLLEYRSNKEIRGGREILLTAISLDIEHLYDRCYILHIYHYEGSAGADMWDVVRRVSQAHMLIKGELR